MSEAEAVSKPVEAAPAAEQADANNTESTMLKTAAKIDYKDVKKNNKFDPSVREVSDDPDAIRKQVRQSQAKSVHLANRSDA